MSARARCYVCKRVYDVVYPKGGDGSRVAHRRHRTKDGTAYCVGSHSPVEPEDIVEDNDE